MIYTDFDFYTNMYFGNIIPERDFPRLARRASDKIDSWTFGRLEDTSWLTEKQFEKVQSACCALAESLYYREILAVAGIETTKVDSEGKGKVVSSISSGSESISYATGGASSGSLEGAAVKQAIADGEKQAWEYLGRIMYKDKNYTILSRGWGNE